MNPWAAGAIGCVIGILAATAWSFETRLSAPAELPAVATTTSTSTPVASGLITVQDQAAGGSIQVDSVQVSTANLWVAVEEFNGDSLGNVLGAAFVNGPANHVVVPLLRPTVPGTTYAVVLYRDNGDKTFSLDADSIYVDFASGQRVVALFKTF